MKKLLFALPLLALAFVFVYCDRSQFQDEINAADPNASVHERGTCVVTFDRASPTVVDICGTNLNAATCASCIGTKSTGFNSMPAGVTPFVLTLTTPIELSLTSATGNTVSISAGGNPPVVVNIPGGGCRRVRIDNSCAVTPI